ncbi:S41 family peptidase [Flavobacterium myungsuense]|uniref:S41 family peptidase n=1 Tax=Flavobacterium myungsuense TaxID=651823 RepID=UPI003635633B
MYRDRANTRNENLSQLSKSETYTLNLADYDNGNFTPNGRSVSLTKTVLSENPVYINKVIESGNAKIGYLMYNGFYPNYETQLNNAFGELKSQGITDFVLDLRYNPGGSVATATRLASMITGQFKGQVFARQQWNAKVEANFNATKRDNLTNFFTDKINSGATINSLNLTKIYILTSENTASASELVINGLKPYINVIQIGDFTIGKNVGSITLYDSPDFSKKDINPSHRYAMQPLVLKIVNKDGFGDYNKGGLKPDTELKEDYTKLGILGDSSDPLLNAAILQIRGSGRKAPQNPKVIFENIIDNYSLNRFKSEMYVELP